MLEPYACLHQLSEATAKVEFVAAAISTLEPRCVEEEAWVAAWAPRRRAEFLSGRACARRALARLGVAGGSIAFDIAGAPCWPAGFVGSISHKRHFCVAAAARADQFAGIGVDLERGALDAGLSGDLCLPEELAELSGLQNQCGDALTLVLSAKEAFFKCQYPLTRKVLRWRDVRVTFGIGRFAVSCEGQPIPNVTGTFRTQHGWVAALATASLGPDRNGRRQLGRPLTV